MVTFYDMCYHCEKTIFSELLQENLLPSGSEQHEVLGLGSIQERILPSRHFR